MRKKFELFKKIAIADISPLSVLFGPGKYGCTVSFLKLQGCIIVAVLLFYLYRYMNFLAAKQSFVFISSVWL